MSEERMVRLEDDNLDIWKMLRRLREERADAIAMARGICESEGWYNGWPDELHMADVIEKRIFNMTRSMSDDKKRMD